MKNQSKIDMTKRAALVCAAYLLFVAAGGVLLQAQEEGAAAEPPTLGILMEPTSAGNTFQANQMVFHAGQRDLERAEDLAAKAASTDDPDKAAKFLEKSIKANESAIQQFTQALRRDPELFEAYGSLGLAYRRLGKYQEALQVHSMALQRDPQSVDNFRGWSEALLSMDMLGDATTAYDRMVESGSPGAPILMEEIKGYLTAKQADPGDLDPAHVERLAAWVAEHGG